MVFNVPRGIYVWGVCHSGHAQCLDQPLDDLVPHALSDLLQFPSLEGAQLDIK